MQVGGGIEAELCVTHALAGSKRRGAPAPEAFEIAAYQIRGHRDEQQDRFIVHKLNENLLLVGVFDGHGDDGGRVAEVAARMLPVVLSAKLTETIEPAIIAKALTDTFLYIDATLAAKETVKSKDSGTTGVAVVITPTHYISANVGDSRAVLLRRATASTTATVTLTDVQLSTDHDVQNATEVTRACAAGATLDDEYFTLGDGGLQLSRALGDFSMKEGRPPILLAEPDIKIMRRTATDDAYVWLFSDGITDAMKGYEHGWYIRIMERLITAGTRDARLLSRAVVRDAFSGTDVTKPVAETGGVSSDNITTVLVRLPERRSAIGAVTRRVKSAVATAAVAATTTTTAQTIKRKPRGPRAPKGPRGVTVKNLDTGTKGEPTSTLIVG